MVESIQSSQFAKLRVLSGQTQTASQPATANQADIGPKAVEKVTLHESSITTLVADLKEKGPPFDMEKVSRIKEALAEGSYPIDRGKLADRLFQDLHSMAY